MKYDVMPKEDGPNVFIRLEDDHSDRRVPLSTIVGIYSRHFDEGDRVRLIAQGFLGVVIATHEADVWVKLDPPHEGMCTVTTSDLEPIPDAAEEPPVDTSDTLEAPKSFFEKATFVEPEAEAAAPEHDRLRGPDGEEIKF